MISKNICDKKIDVFSYSLREFPDEYPDEIITALGLISYNVDNIEIMGSFRQRALWFSGDIDGFEIIPYSEQTKAIKDIVLKIVNSYDYGTKLILGDIKIGTSKYRELLNYIGRVENNKVYGFNLHALKLIIRDTYVKEINEMIEQPTVQQWLEYNKFINSFVALRWTPEMIFRGQHKDGYELTATLYNSPVTKIDMYYNYYGKYTEITNIIFNSKKNTDFFIKQIKLGIMTELNKNNLLKGLKKMYSIARLLKDCNILEKIAPILISPTNLLNSCKSDLNVISDMIDFGFDINRNRELLNTHFNTIILKIAGYYYENLDTIIFNQIKNLHNINDNEQLKEYIEKISDYLNEIVNNNVEVYIKKNNITFKKYVL